jgi:outer membrane immunogenic protein
MGVAAMRILKIASLASLSAFVLGSAALAADMRLPAKGPMVAPPPPVVSWTGCYLYGGGGYGLSNIDHNFIAAPGSGLTGTVQTTSGGRGWLAGGGGGCDYQFGPGSGFWSNWVVGAFADYDWMNIHRNFQETLTSGNEKESSAWAVGGRIGYLVTPNVFTYWNGGYTQSRFDQINLSLSFPPVTPLFAIGSHTYHGWFIGGGTEISLSGLFGLPLPSGLFWRSEYRFSTFDSANLPVIFTPTGALAGTENMKPYVQTVTTSLVWRFGWLGH